jgi:hypothetical protein
VILKQGRISDIIRDDGIELSMPLGMRYPDMAALPEQDFQADHSPVQSAGSAGRPYVHGFSTREI